MHSFILAAREREKHSACCVRNDRSGCVQTSAEECSVRAPARSSCPAALRSVLVARVRPRVELVELSFTLDRSTVHLPVVRGPSRNGQPRPAPPARPTGTVRESCDVSGWGGLFICVLLLCKS